MNTYQWTALVFLVFALALTAFRAWNKDTKGAFAIGIGVVLLGALFFVSGCTVSPERLPYMEVGMALDTQKTVGSNPACVVRIKQPIGFGKLEPDWLTIGYNHQSSCRDLNDRATVDQVEIIAKIPLGRR
jgi:hypothetical protein